jgi:hypothetical protein
MRKADNTIETVIESKWVGACPAGMKLGDVAGPDGKVMMNVLTPCSSNDQISDPRIDLGLPA